MKCSKICNGKCYVIIITYRNSSFEVKCYFFLKSWIMFINSTVASAISTIILKNSINILLHPLSGRKVLTTYKLFNVLTTRKGSYFLLFSIIKVRSLKLLSFNLTVLYHFLVLFVNTFLWLFCNLWIADHFIMVRFTAFLDYKRIVPLYNVVVNTKRLFFKTF